MNAPSWTHRWMGLTFAGYGVLIALVVNKFVFDGPGWSKGLVMLSLAGIMGMVGHRIGQRRVRDSE